MPVVYSDLQFLTVEIDQAKLASLTERVMGFDEIALLGDFIRDAILPTGMISTSALQKALL